MTALHPLISLASDPSDAAREALVTATASQFLDAPTLPSESERALFCEVLVKLYSHARQEIRQRLSTTLAMADWAPADLLRELALDSIDVAQPIISFSPCLTDEILVEIIELRDFHHRMCIAERPSIGETVTHRLIKTDNVAIVATLANNATARIHVKDFTLALGVLKNRQTDLDTLILRHDLPPSLIATAFSLAGAQAKLSLTLRLPPKLENRLARVTAFVAADAADGHTGKPLSTALHTQIQSNVRDMTKRPTPGSLIAALMRGERDIFYKSIAELLGLPRDQVERRIAQGDPQVIALVSRACNFDMSLARTIFETLDTKSRKWTLAEDRMVAMIWMRHSASAARMHFASSLPTGALGSGKSVH